MITIDLRNKSIMLVFILMWFTITVPAQKVMVWPQLLSPNSIHIDDTGIYVVDEASIFIYSSRDYSLVNRFGKKGEGPQEFRMIPAFPVDINVQTEHLIVNSIGKLSFYTKSGRFIEERKSSGALSLYYIPLGNKFVGVRIVRDGGINYKTLCLFGPDLKAEKEVYRVVMEEQPGNADIKILQESFSYQVYDNKIFVAGKKGFVVDVLDSKGGPLFSIKREYEPIKFTDRHKKAALDFFRTHPQHRSYFHTIKDRLKFPQTFPVISEIRVSGGKIYVLTFKSDDDQREDFIFDTHGKLLKKMLIPVKKQSTAEPFPFCIYRGKLYQLIENEDEVEWEFHVTQILPDLNG